VVGHDATEITVTLARKIGTTDRSLALQVVDHLRDAIMDGSVAPGQKLPEQALADQLQVSRIPLREAILQLEAEGFVRSVPRRGSHVTRLTMKDVHDLFDIRESLEVLAAQRAAERAAEIDPVLLAEVKESLIANREAVATGDDREIAASSVAFHHLIVEMSGNDLLSTLMRPVEGRVEWLFRMTSQRDQQAACREHDQLLRAILRGDVEESGKLALAHIADGRAPSVEILSSVLPES
jgi:DNA-binding GntR family transcriptional regulator